MPSDKERRRQAAQRERERRAQEIESQRRQAAADVNWGSATTLLNGELREQIIRLGGLPAEPTGQSAVEILTQQIKWPTGTFRSSEIRFRGRHAGTDAAEMTDTQIQDSVLVWCHDFEFAMNGSFYPDWQADFTAVDTAQFIPFGADAHYFYLIGDNPQDSSNPLVYSVDHETVFEKPYNSEGTTVLSLLELLIAN
ncbi:hypothetical protein Enr10x_36740 [Gimesia panareensis]|uniref:Uncharacterized protein n=1 Tax=Gimesia panareensis TaxID=2527978 RepID=A0A517Q9M3_9PLAN|nr:hypothetical protein [Gimesia panareensis]QDT28332.1 hypothetical protein Enr10x_36740 [Gimesia panareensis]